MKKAYIVWNPNKTEFVGFVKEDLVSGELYPEAEDDAEHAAGGLRSNPVSSLAYEFREQYEDTEEECSTQIIKIDETKAQNIERW